MLSEGSHDCSDGGAFYRADEGDNIRRDLFDNKLLHTILIIASETYVKLSSLDLLIIKLISWKTELGKKLIK